MVAAHIKGFSLQKGADLKACDPPPHPTHNAGASVFVSPYSCTNHVEYLEVKARAAPVVDLCVGVWLWHKNLAGL